MSLFARLACLITLLGLSVGGVWAQSPAKYPFRLNTEGVPQGHVVMARNDGPAPVSVRIAIEGAEQIMTDRPVPLYVVVPPHSLTPVLRTQARPNVGYTFRLKSTWSVGDYNTNPPSDVAYRLPFREGMSFRISQASGGPISTHTTPDSQHAVDFPMPENTPITAIADGIVVRAEEEQMEGGQRPDLLTKANSIRILHRDGSMALYGHLAYKGVLVGIGQQVSAGQTIGLSGSTGYSSGPHLHLTVLRLLRNENGFSYQSIPFRFYVGNPSTVFTPTYGMLVNADYRNPGQIPPIVARPRTTTTTITVTPVTPTAPTPTPVQPTRPTTPPGVPYLPPGVSPR